MKLLDTFSRVAWVLGCIFLFLINQPLFSESVLVEKTNMGSDSPQETVPSSQKDSTIDVKPDEEVPEPSLRADEATPSLTVSEADSPQVALFEEDFSEGTMLALNEALNASTDPVWMQDTDLPPHTFEGFAFHGSNPRGFSETYDPGDGPITIPGGLEVNSIKGPTTVSAAIQSLPVTIDTSKSARLSFFAGIRNSILGLPDSPEDVHPTLRIVNVTDGNVILNTTPITGINIGTDEVSELEWKQKIYKVYFQPDDLGDEIRIEWFGGGGNSGNGLLLLDIRFWAIETAVYQVAWENVSNGIIERSVDMATWEPFEVLPAVSGFKTFTFPEQRRAYFRFTPLPVE